MSADMLEVLRQLSFLSSVLAGFALTAAIQLIPFAKKNSLGVATLALFLASSIATLVWTFVCVIIMMVILYPMRSGITETQIRHFLGGAGVIPMIGLILFLAGIGLVGWLHSKPLGIITTVLALLGLMSVLRFLIGFIGS
nr:hypothetical protein [Chloroflexota bacterium]